MRLFDRLRGATAKGRAAVVGLDGVGLPLARELVAKGITPRLGAFMEAGSVGPMRSTIPTISSVSWASFLTGNNPGRHGIYGFTGIDRAQFKQRFTGFRDLEGPTLLDVLARSGRRAVVVNVPGTYPASAVAGVMISGFVAVNLERAVHPPELLPKLKQAGYKIDVDYIRANERPEEFFRDLFDTLDARRRVLVELARDEAWDVFIGVFTETDRLHHYFWHAWEDESCPYHDRFVEFYSRLDEALGELLEILDGVPTMVLADHGHMLIDSEFYPNVWLREHGLLEYRTEKPRTVTDIASATSAFVMDPGRIYLNLRGRYPTGSLEPASAESVLDEISAGLEACEHDGRRPVSRTFRRDELYSGPQLEDAPDLVLHFSPGFDIKGSMRATELFGRSALTGMHTYDDSFFAASRPGMELGDLDITDVAPTLLAAVGIPAAGAMDGRDRGLV